MGQSASSAIPPKKPQMPSFDVDDLVKRIDAKIAELEAQEKAEEEAKKNGGVIPNKEIQPSPITNNGNGVTQPQVNNSANMEVREIPKTQTIPSPEDILKGNLTNQASVSVPSEPVVNMVEPTSIQEVKAEPVSNLGFNPFISDEQVKQDYKKYHPREKK